MNGERVHRYAFALGYARDRRVLVAGERDPALVASLREVARELATVVLDPFGSEVRLPLADACVDLVVALSGVQRLADPAGLVREARRVLAPGGVLCAAFPAAGGAAWRLDDVRALLSAEFAGVALHAQRGFTGSLLHALDAPGGGEPDAWYVYGASGLRPGIDFTGSPGAYVALCSDSALPPRAARSVLADENRVASAPEAPVPERAGGEAGGGPAHRARAELALRERQIAGLNEAAERARAEIASLMHLAHVRDQKLGAEREAHRASLTRILSFEERERERARELEAARAQAAELGRALAEREAALRDVEAALHAELQRVSSERDGAEERARAEERVLREVLDSRSWRLTKGLRVIGAALRPAGRDQR